MNSKQIVIKQYQDIDLALMHKHTQSILFFQWLFSEYIHTGDILIFLSEVISKLPEVSEGVHRPATGQLINRERLML